jgi:hypothetical protein
VAVALLGDAPLAPNGAGWPAAGDGSGSSATLGVKKCATSLATQERMELRRRRIGNRPNHVTQLRRPGPHDRRGHGDRCARLHHLDQRRADRRTGAAGDRLRPGPGRHRRRRRAQHSGKPGAPRRGHAAPGHHRRGTAKLTRSGQRLVLDTGRAAACPAGAGTCLVHVIVRPQLGGSPAARAAAPRTIGTATVAITAGHSTRLKVTLTKAAAQLARNQRLRITVTLTAERGTVTGTPNTIKLNLRTPAPPPHHR